jgi:hypothetical protein
MPDNEDKNQNPSESGIKIREYYHGAWSGEFPTIIVVTLAFAAGSIATGALSAIGKDIWETLKVWMKRRFNKFEQYRQSQEGTRNPRNRVISVYIVGQIGDVPIIYYIIPSKGQLDIDFDINDLLKAEAKIRTLLDAIKSRKDYLGINLAKMGSASCFSIFAEIPSQRWFDGPNAFNSPEEHTIEELKVLLLRK